MDETTSELLKSILSEVKSHNSKIDNINTKIDKTSQNLNDKLNTVQLDVSKIMSKTEVLDVDIIKTKADLNHLEHTIRGNGSPGLKTKIELMDLHQSNLKEVVESLKTTIKESNDEKHKGSIAIKVAVVTAASSGVVALVLQLLAVK